MPPLTGEALRPFAEQLPFWKVVDERHLAKSFLFPDFRRSLDFVNAIGAVADQVGALLSTASGVGNEGMYLNSTPTSSARHSFILTSGSHAGSTSK